VGRLGGDLLRLDDDLLLDLLGLGAGLFPGRMSVAMMRCSSSTTSVSSASYLRW
jgi:hypothetical protein